MNERIRALAEQSTDDIMGVKVLDKRMFAESIVRECIAVLDEDDGATHHCELLLEHFGVEDV